MPSPAPRPAFIYTASIHPSIHPSINQAHIAYPSRTVSRKQSQQANQATNTPKSYILVPVTVCVFSKSKQPAEPTDTPTKGRRVKKKGAPATNKPSDQTFSPNAVDTCFELVAHQATNKPATKTTPHNPVFSQMLSILGSHCGRGAAPSLYLHSIDPSIHPSIHPLYHASNQQQANQATNTPKS